LDFVLAQHFLKQRNINLQLLAKGANQSFGDNSFSLLQHQSAGYNNVNSNGYQIMLNYRSNESPFYTITLSEILRGDFDPTFIKDKVVLIGTVAPSFNAHAMLTPYGYNRQISGLEMRGHMLSQIISSALDNRPLIWWWSSPIETTWVFFWSVLGGLLAWKFHKPLNLGIAISLAISSLYGICWIVYLKGGWIPLIPSILALVLASITITCLYFKNIKVLF
jgi:CHASE2 domain-containing sensor protein